LEFFLFILEAREPKKLLWRDMSSQFLPVMGEGTINSGEDIFNRR
jgi:hypothetical protein